VAKWIFMVCGALTAGFVALALVVGVALWQGASLAARVTSIGLEQARTALEAAVPPEASVAARARLDETIEALRDGRFDPAALGEVAWWLPGALVDGRLDTEERRILWEKLDRLAPAGSGEAAAARS